MTRLVTMVLLIVLGAVVGSVGQEFAQAMPSDQAFNLGFGCGCACLVMVHFFRPSK